jgi:hypothetical protein
VRLTAGLLIAVAFLGCSDPTPGSCDIIPIVTVTDGATGQPICDATLVAVSPVLGNGGELLPPVEQDGSPSCSYNANVQDSVPFTITASKMGYRTTTVANVQIISTRCANRPSPQRVDIILQPN